MDNRKKLIIEGTFMGTSVLAAYAAMKLIKSISKVNMTIKSADYSALRRDVRHLVEMIETMGYGI